MALLDPTPIVSARSVSAPNAVDRKEGRKGWKEIRKKVGKKEEKKKERKKLVAETPSVEAHCAGSSGVETQGEKKSHCGNVAFQKQ